MLDRTFYWGTTRKAIIAFGNIFNEVFIERRNSAGALVQKFKVPLSYAPRQKMIARIEQQPNLEQTRAEVILPRMSFEIMGLQYDPARKVSPIQSNRAILSNDPSKLLAQYAPTPYNINMNLYVFVKNQDDGLQIIEQILPYFNPDYNVSLKAIPQLNILNDLPIILNNVEYQDEYEGDFAVRRVIVWTLSFTLKINYYGPVQKTGIIRKVDVDIFNDAALTTNLVNYQANVTPDNALPTGNFEFNETFTDFE